MEGDSQSAETFSLNPIGNKSLRFRLRNLASVSSKKDNKKKYFFSKVPRCRRASNKHIVIRKCTACNSFMSTAEDTISVSKKEDATKKHVYFHSHASCIAQMQEDMYHGFAPKLKFKTWKTLFLKNVTPSSNADNIEDEIEKLRILCGNK